MLSGYLHRLHWLHLPKKRRTSCIPSIRGEMLTRAYIFNVCFPRTQSVKSEPPATLKTDSRTLEWVLPLKMRPGGKQVLQARLGVDEGQAPAALPQTAQATVKCHLLDSMFSSVELEMAAMAEDGLHAAPGRVMKRCRVQCTQQG